jgi:Leucine-rich repeat (LRR) protein
MHEAYEALLKDAEQRLDQIYRSAMEHTEPSEKDSSDAEAEQEAHEINEEVVGLLEKGKMLDRVDLSNRGLKHLPEAFGKLSGLVYLNLSDNQLEVSNGIFDIYYNCLFLLMIEMISYA